jgi:MFS family permease
MTSFTCGIGGRKSTLSLRLPPALHHRRFALFWAGILFAWTGNQILIWALPWHIRNFTDQPIALGSVGLIRVIPTIFVSIFAGMVADLFSRRKVVFVTQGVMGLVSLSLGILTLSGKAQLWHIYALLAVHSTAFSFDLPARYSLTPNLVPPRILPNALSVEMIAFQFGSLAGPVMSGYLIAQVSQAAAYFSAVAAFAVMLIALISMGSVPQDKLSPTQPGVDWSALNEGIRFTFRHPLILPSMLLDFLATLLIRADSLMPIFARDVLGVGAAGYGWLSAAQALGAAFMGVTLSQVGRIRRQGTLLLGAVAMIGLGALVFGLSRSFALSMGALVLVGASDSLSSIIRSAIRQLQTPDRMRGRMTGVNQIFFMGGPYLGDVKSGYLGTLIGVPLAVALGGVACLFSVAWVARRWPRLRAYNGDEAMLAFPHRD